MEKLFFVILFFLLAAILLFLAVVFFLASRAFDAANEKESKWVGRAPASLKATKHKKNVTIYGKSRHGPVTSLFIKNMTKGTYVYTVNDKQYKMRVTKYLTTPRQMPYLSTAFYIKIFPRIAYLKDDLQLYDVYAIGCFGFAGVFIYGAIKALLLLVA